MKLRSFASQDAKEVHELFLGTVHSINTKDYTPSQIEAWAPKNPYISFKGRWQSLDQNIALVVESNAKKIIGFGDMTPEGLIHNIYTHKDHQSQGVATLILEEMEKQARSLHLGKVCIEASVTALSFFLSKHFKIERSQLKVINGASLKNFLMYKSV